MIKKNNQLNNQKYFMSIAIIFAMIVYYGNYDIYVSSGDYLFRPDIKIWLDKISGLITDQGFGQLNSFIIAWPYYYLLSIFYIISPKFAFSFGHCLPLVYICLAISYKASEIILRDNRKSLYFAILYTLCPISTYLILIPEPFSFSYIFTPGIFIFIYKFYIDTNKKNLLYIFGIGYLQSLGYTNPGFMISTYSIVIGFYVYIYIKKIKNHNNLYVFLITFLTLLASQIHTIYFSLAILLEIKSNISSKNEMVNMYSWAENTAYYLYSLFYFKQDFDITNLKRSEVITIFTYSILYIIYGLSIKIKNYSVAILIVSIAVLNRGIEVLLPEYRYIMFNNLYFTSIKSPDKIVHLFNFIFLTFLFSQKFNYKIAKYFNLLFIFYISAMLYYVDDFVNGLNVRSGTVIYKKIKLSKEIEIINDKINSFDQGGLFRILTVPGVSENTPSAYRFFPSEGIFNIDPYMFKINNNIISLSDDYFGIAGLRHSNNDYKNQNFYNFLSNVNIKYILVYKNAEEKEFHALISEKDLLYKNTRMILETTNFILLEIQGEIKNKIYIPKSYREILTKDDLFKKTSDIILFSKYDLKFGFNNQLVRLDNFIKAGSDKYEFDITNVDLKENLIIATSLLYNNSWEIEGEGVATKFKCGPFICFNLAKPTNGHYQLKAKVFNIYKEAIIKW